MARTRKNVGEDHNVVKMRRHGTPGIAFFLILLILLYLIVVGINFLTKSHVSIYEVNTSEISDDSPFAAYVMRDEEVVTADDAGYINYFIPEGSRVAKGNVIYTLDDNDSLRETLLSLRDEKATTTQISPIREQISTFYNSYTPANYSQTADFHFKINNIILEHSRGNLFRDFKKQIKTSGTASSYRKFKAAKTGVISYYTDGFEALTERDISPEIMARFGATTRKQVAVNDQVAIGDPAYKLVTSNDWSLIAELDDDYYNSLKDMESIRVTVLRDGISFNAGITHIDQNGAHFVKLSTSRFMERYINDRFLSIEFGIKRAKGLKIPNSSILKKDYFEVPTSFVSNVNNRYSVVRQYLDEENKTQVENIDITSYYVENDLGYIRDLRLHDGDTLLSPTGGLFTLTDHEVRDGVYCVNEGFCRFKPVEVLYHNKEYSIISDTTRDGLKPFDHIVVDPGELNDDDFID